MVVNKDDVQLVVMLKDLSVLFFCRLDPRVGHTMDILSPFITVLSF